MWFDPPPRRSDPTRPDDEEGDGWPGMDYYGLKSEQFIVTPNPEVGRIWLPDGDAIIIHERDDRFGFTRWVETPEEYE